MEDAKFAPEVVIAAATDKLHELKNRCVELGSKANYYELNLQYVQEQWAACLRSRDELAAWLSSVKPYGEGDTTQEPA